jgi:hypothetical protein
MGMMIGSTVGTLFGASIIGRLFSIKPPKLPAQKLGELSQQTAKEGEPRPIAYGICRPIGGNIMYMSLPIRKMVKTYVGEAGGKGGSKKKKQYQDVEHVYRYYAIRVCEGPITGYRRIWRNGALVYDGRKGSDWGAKNNHLFFETYRLYTGSWGQMPDSVLQSQQEMDIPAYRGTAYLVANNEDLTDFGGAIPQWQFEVVRSEGYYLTSRPYALEDTPSSGVVAVGAKQSPSTAVTESSGVKTVGVKGPPFITTDPEKMNATGGVDRIVMTGAQQYTVEPQEMNATGGVDRIVLIPAVAYTVEPQEMNATGGVDRIIMTRKIA